MRVAVLADIHGNLLAFEAVLAHVRALSVDQIVILGDIVTGSPDSAACCQLARSLSCPTLRGNHERYVADFGTSRADPAWSTPQYTPVQWTMSQLSAEERAALAALPTHLRLPEFPDLLFVHGSLRSDADVLPAHTPAEALPAMFPEGDEGLILRAHDHVGATHLWGGRRIVTVGSVGLPLNGIPTAQYLLLEQRRDGWHTAHQSVPYDLDAALHRFTQSGYLQAAGVMARLFQRELATASFQLVPFLHFYRRLCTHEPVDLEEGLRRFLAV